MSENWVDDYESDEERAWGLIDRFLSAHDNDDASNLIAYHRIGELAQAIGLMHLAECRKTGRYSIVESSTIREIVDEVSVGPKRLKGRDQICDEPAVYLFLSLAADRVIKVGESDDPQQRIVHGHLRHGVGDADLRWHYDSVGRWPNAIDEDEIVAIVLRPQVRDREMRRLIETGFKNLFHPDMP